jgi:hypothetical protein
MNKIGLFLILLLSIGNANDKNDKRSCTLLLETGAVAYFLED